LGTVVAKALGDSKEVVFVGERVITRLSEKRGGRYVIYLPVAMNKLWEALWRDNVKVIVYLEVVREEESKPS